ncbi:hypothetical protein [Streptomyces sp. NPDC057052]|uniref:hypothetical protein n=1 Tax=Streptomyces sp. NPDC057052 TaxID=3346010 RepID=UPI0036368092
MCTGSGRRRTVDRHRPRDPRRRIACPDDPGQWPRCGPAGPTDGLAAARHVYDVDSRADEGRWNSPRAPRRRPGSVGPSPIPHHEGTPAAYGIGPRDRPRAPDG